MIIGLTGFAQSGKDTVAEILVRDYGFTRIAFADRIRELLYELNPIVTFVAGEPVFLKTTVDELGWDEAKKHSQIRRYLQDVGVGARNVFGDGFWIKEAFACMRYTHKNYVITDVRFTNEADVILNPNTKYSYGSTELWRIKRPGIEAVNAHVSESDMLGYEVTQILVNGGTKEELEVLVKQRMEYALNAN